MFQSYKCIKPVLVNTFSYFSLTKWQMAQCVKAAFFNLKDIIKDTFLLSKMILSVGGVFLIVNESPFATIVSSFLNVRALNHMNFQLNALNFNLQVIVSTFLTLAAPMIITSIQTAAYDPGLPLGLPNLPPGCKRKTLQILMSIFFPFTILLLRLQHQIVQKKRERILELQNPYLIREFNRLSSLLQKMDEHKKKMVKIDIAFEIAHQMFINLVLVLFSTSETR